jgi:1,4-dihydroxy-2-naphthoate octaprenyltransferase
VKDSYLNRNLIKHLRLPFSFFLMPVYFFALSQAFTVNVSDALLVFVSLHLFIYPASNLYNSLMDKDTGAIGGLEKPPPVESSFFAASILLDALGLLLLALADTHLILPGLVYTGVSRAYSWHGIRIKKYAFAGWLTVAVFQGGFTYFLVHAACTGTYGMEWITTSNFKAALLATLLIGGYYPFTQIYQHEEDTDRGDITISIKLGIRGTFIFSGVLFMLAVLLAFGIFETKNLLVFLTCLLPVVAYYIIWFKKVGDDTENADFKHTMRMTMISSACMTLCWLCMLLIRNYQIG